MSHRGNVLQGKIAELTEKCAQLEAHCSLQDCKLQEVQQDNAVLQSALLTQSQQLDSHSAELTAICQKHNAHLWQPSAQLQFDPSVDIALKFPVTAEDGKSEHLLVRGTDLIECAFSLDRLPLGGDGVLSIPPECLHCLSRDKQHR